MNEFICNLFSTGLAIVFSLFIFIFILERLFPKQSPNNVSKFREFRNVWLGVFYRLIFSPLIIAPLVIYITRDSSYKLHRPDWFSGVFSFVIDLILLDLLNYSFHILAHKVPVLWRFHAIHHLDTHLDSTTGLRQHFGEKFLALAVRLPVMFLLAVPYQVVAIFEVIAFCFGIFHHNNINLPAKVEVVVGKLFVMPSFHNIHHGREQQHTDSNYGFIFSVWDRLFHTKSLEIRPADFSNGLDHQADFSFLKLMYLPFTTKSVKDWE